MTHKKELPPKLLEAVGDDEELAALIMWNIGEKSWEEWMNTCIPALQGRKPKNLLGKKKDRHLVRAMLMRMP